MEGRIIVVDAGASPRAATPLHYAIQKQCLRFYLPLCNRTPFYPPNPLCISTLYWLQILRFICNHLPPSATDATLVSAVLWNGELLLAEQAIRIYNRRFGDRTSYCYMSVGWQMTLHLPPYLQPHNKLCISVLQRFLP